LAEPGLRSGDGVLIAADVSDGTRIEGAAGLPTNPAGRAVEEYLSPFSMTPLSLRPPR
jgi:outer membrane usher protein FimD/PapC